MKKVALVAGIIFISTTALATEYNGPILEWQYGGIAHNGSKKECSIYANNSGFNLKEIKSLIKEASKKYIGTGLHVVAQVPSVEYYAYIVTGEKDGTPTIEKILLREDHSTYQWRSGKAAQRLVDLIDKLCSK